MTRLGLVAPPARPGSTHPQPPPGPVAEQAVRAVREDPLGFLESLLSTYGDLSSHRAGGEPVVVVSSPELARTVLRERYDRYVKTGTPDELMLRPLLGNGLLTSDGDDWLRQRHACAPAFRPATVEQYAPLMTATASALAQRWLAQGTVRVDHDLMGLTLEVVASAALGTDLTGMGPGFGQAVDAVNRYLGHYVPGEAVDDDLRRRRAAFDRGRSFLEMLARTLISARRAGGGTGRDDLLAALLVDSATRADGDTELREQVLTMIMAGHETTAKSLTWTLHLLAEHPLERAAVEAELDEVLDGRAPTALDARRLPRTRAVLLESVRLFPPVWLLSRRCVVDDVLGGALVAEGTLVCISPWVLHRRADVWPDPTAFRPARFLDGRLAESHAYLPFGGGPRTCIGQHFALLESLLVLATLLQRLRLDPVAGATPVVPEALVTLRPRDGLTMEVQPR